MILQRLADLERAQRWRLWMVRKTSAMPSPVGTEQFPRRFGLPKFRLPGRLFQSLASSSLCGVMSNFE